MKYKLEEIAQKIFAVVVTDRYDRAMLFCKAQEFYESPNPSFQNKHFSIWDYMKWYSKTNRKGFTYAMDWSGFNIPLNVISQCYCDSNPYRIETPYDQKMIEILEKSLESLKSPKDNTTTRNTGIGMDTGYLIGTDSLESETFSHEICHAKYMTDPEYKARIQTSIEIIKTRHPQEFSILSQNIVSMGYSSSVVEDEIQAYLQDRTPEEDVRKGISNGKLKELKSLFT
jgi:hypothetical protein